MIPGTKSFEQNIQSLQFARILIAQGLVSTENFSSVLQDPNLPMEEETRLAR